MEIAQEKLLPIHFQLQGEGPLYTSLQMPTRVLLSSEQSGGTHTLLEITVPPGAGSPPHAHTVEDETFYILEGCLEFVCEGSTQVAGPGCTLFGPRGRVHWFTNAGTETAKVLVIATPGGIEHFFRELAELPEDAPAADVINVLHKYGMTVPA